MTKKVNGTPKKLTLNKRSILKISESAMKEVVGGVSSNEPVSPNDTTSHSGSCGGSKTAATLTSACVGDKGTFGEEM